MYTPDKSIIERHKDTWKLIVWAYRLEEKNGSYYEKMTHVALFWEMALEAKAAKFPVCVYYESGFMRRNRDCDEDPTFEAGTIPGTSVCTITIYAKCRQT